MPVPDQHLWSTDDPVLYDLRIELKGGAAVLDRMTRYFSMRKVSLGEVDGCQRILLNNRFVFQIGLLDEGYWPEGISTAPMDEALRFDPEQAKALGYNLVRKHIKVEPARRLARLRSGDHQDRS